jgi:protein-S-isoprenylcysteine O-methyltransferase Ste14
MKRWGVLLFGFGSYLMFLGVALYAFGFVAGIGTPTRMDGPAAGSPVAAIAIDLLLVALFAIQHSIMARPWFKQWWTRRVPSSAERSVYIFASNLTLMLLFWQWRPVGGVVWNVTSEPRRWLIWSLSAPGFVTILTASLLIGHFDLFGLRQVWLYFCQRPYEPLPMMTPGPYRYIRHPLYSGTMLMLWVTPTMTSAHLLLAIGLTIYILVAVRFEERDLMQIHPSYAEYRRRVPMFVPRLWPPT